MFDVRIDIQGLFWIHPDQLPRPEKVLFIAPWVVPEKPEDCPHDFIVQWKPNQLDPHIPLQAKSVWRLEGQRVRFGFGDSGPSQLETAPETWGVPWVHHWQTENGQTVKGLFDRTVVPGAAIRDDVRQAPAQFRAKSEPGFGCPTNQEGVMGQVLVDRGKLVNDEIVAIPATFSTGGYSGYFTNRLTLIAKNVETCELFVEDLVTGFGGGAPAMSFSPPGPTLELSIRHICPSFLLRDDPPFLPMNNGPNFPHRDEDFRHLYKLCKDLNVQPLPIPVRHGTPHSKPLWDCGSMGGG